MRVLVTGGTGFVGSKLVESLFRNGHEVSIITRDAERAKAKVGFPVKFIEGDLEHSTIDKLSQLNFESVINLAGENIGEGKWDHAEKIKIRKSRVDLTKNLIASLNHKNLEVFIQASAIGIYRDSDKDEWLTESTKDSNSFLSDVCKEWEAQVKALPESVRIVIPRIGVILGHDGALMSKLLPLYRAGLGGKLGDGKQWMSWVHIKDVVRFLETSMSSSQIEGAVNLTAPNPVQNKSFNNILGKLTQRHAVLTVPKSILEITMGEKSYLALSSQRISSRAQEDFGFNFEFPDIESACAEICCYETLHGEQGSGFHYHLRKAMFLPCPLEEVFEFFTHPENLKKVAPKDLKLELVKTSEDRLIKGSLFTFKMTKFGLPIKIKSKVHDFIEMESFTDSQVKGPFKSWEHTHTFDAVEGGTIVVDELKYKLPLGPIGDIAAKKVDSDVKSMFSHRMDAIRKYFGDR